jgi:L-fucose isomerase-like protein
MKKSSVVKVGIFSGYDPRPWVMEECAAGDAAKLAGLAARLREFEGFEIVYPGDSLAGYDRLCHSMELADRYAAAFADAGVSILVNVHQTWTFPQLSQKVITSFIGKMRGRDPGFVPRVILASIQDTKVPGMVSGMATGGALAQAGIAYSHVCGYFDAPEFLEELKGELKFYGRMARAHDAVRRVAENLHREHILEFGSFSLRMPTTRIDQEELMARWGISSENLDQQVFLDRALGMMEWKGAPGASGVARILDARVEGMVKALYDRFPEKYAAIPDRSVSREKFALQCAMYCAVRDIAGERGATAVTIKCQDECSSRYATCCIATSFMGNDLDPLGAAKPMVPASCETDMPTLLSQVLLCRLSGKPAGFGDFRYVKTDGNRTLLAVVNCGQHPLYYAGAENEGWEAKLAETDFPGQEHFYSAGGSAVRMRTAGGQRITLARIGVERGRLHLVAMGMETIDVDQSRHCEYNQAWPIIEGVVPVTDRVLGKLWPSNHLGFVYGDWLAELAELAEQMGLGYTIWERDGREYRRPS